MNTEGTTEFIRAEVGTGGTIYLFSDRVACTVISLPLGHRASWVEVQEDRAIRTDDNGMSDSQDYTYQPNPEGRKTRFTLRKNGLYIRQGDPMKNGILLKLGSRSHFHDFCF